MSQQTAAKYYSSIRNDYPSSAFGDYSNPTISSNSKTRSRSSSQKYKFTKRPFSRYETNNPACETR